MTLQTHPAMEKSSEVNLSAEHRYPEPHERDALQTVKSTLVDAVLDVGALIDAVLCRCGDWVDWQHYRPLPGIREDNSAAADFIIRLALGDDIFGLRCGGYIEMRAAREERTIEICGGYYDAYDQPEPVINGSLRWDEVNHQEVGQMLLLIHERVMRAHILRETSDDSLQWRPALRTAHTTPAGGDSNGATRFKPIGIG